VSLDVERVYRSHGQIVLRRARALLGNEPDAQEALQEVFASLLQQRKPIASVVAWLYQATTHWCLNQLRNRRTGARLLELRPPPRADAPSPEPPAEVRSLLSLLPDEVAAAVVYHYLDGMTHEEVAQLLGCSRRMVGYLLERAGESLARAESA